MGTRQSLLGGRPGRVAEGPAARTLRRMVAHSAFLVSLLLGDDWVGRRLRVVLLRMCGAHIAAGASVHGGGYISDPRNLVMGRGCFLNRNCYLDLTARLVLEDGVVVGHGVTFITTEHRGLPLQRGVDTSRAIRLEERCWIGANATVLPGVTVGRKAVVAASALITVDVPPGSLVGGVPARTIRTGINQATGGG
jgi:maltose O-acetyltransferase